MYLNTDEVESSMVSLTDKYPNLSKLIELPNRSIENRVIHAITIGRNIDDNPKGLILFTGGVHAREWGGSDICIYFAADILEAYDQEKGLRYGNQYFEAESIRNLIDRCNIIVLPDVNPDGKRYSQNEPSNRNWRGNRHLIDKDCFGVDLNRNYDLLWDFGKFFSPSALVHTSDDPCDPMQVFKGTKAFSEPETQNVKWLLDFSNDIAYYVDIHCRGGLILYSWGLDQNQTFDLTMNFANPSYNSKRGISDDNDYREYVPTADLNHIQLLAKVFHDALRKVRGTDYTVQQAFDLYATSGAGDDYAYSRNIVDQSKSKIHAFTIEFGKGFGDFQPPWQEMTKIITEVCSGMVAFSITALDYTINNSK